MTGVSEIAPRPPAALSLDLDNLWCYQRSFGIVGWRDYPSFMELALPRLLDLLQRLDLTLTLFIIGRDAERATIRGLLAEAVRCGHEAANHSYDHNPAMVDWSAAQLREEIARAGQAIEGATGRRPRGFRGPAYAISPSLLEVLAELNYEYDASSYPNSLGPLARFYHRRQMRRRGGTAPLSDSLYGSLRDGWQPLRPYLWSLGEGTLAEAPVTTLPLLRLPFHGTYLNHLAERSPALARGYFRTALMLCRMRGIAPSFLLHPTDVMGRDDLPGVDYLPGMKRSGAEKAAFLGEILALYKAAFRVQPIGPFLDELRASRRLERVLLAAVS